MSKVLSLTRERIILASIRCFARHGFEKTTFKQIADVAKITQPAIYAHFKDKVDLLHGCCQFASQEGQEFIESRIDPKGNAEARLRGYLRANLGWFSKNPEKGLCLLALYYYSHYNEDLNRLFIAIQTAAVSRIETYLVHGSHEKKWSSHNTHDTARHIHSLVVGEVIKNMHETKNPSTRTLEEKIWKFISHIL